MSDGEVGQHRGEAGLDRPSRTVQEREEEQRERVRQWQKKLRGLFDHLVRQAGGVEWLTSMLDREPSYASKIREAIADGGDRKVQLDWLAPIFEDPAAVEFLMGWLSEELHYKPPVRERTVSPEEIARAAVEVIGEMGALRDPVREAIAKRLGVRVEDVKL